MPVNLNQFLSVAANRTTSEIYVDGPAHQTRAQNRGSFRSWVVGVFQSDTARNQRTETAHAFIAALQEKVSAKASALVDAKPEVIEQYNEDTAEIVESLKRLLADQLNGRKALTANDIHRANEFVDSTLGMADQEKDNLTATLSRHEAIESLEQAAERFYGAQTVAEVRMAAKGIRVAHRTANVPGPQLPAQTLRAYLTGNPPTLSFEQKSALLAELRREINSAEDITDVAIPTFERLSRGEALEANRWTTDVEPGSEEARLLLNTFQKLKQEYLGPLGVLEYFLKADIAEGMREQFLDAKELPLGSGSVATSERSLRDILDDFQAGKQLSEPDVAFARSALSARALNQITQMTPGYLLFSGGGNPRILMTKPVEAAQEVPNHVWQVLTGKGTPNWKAEASKNPQDKEIVYSPSERNPWGLAVGQKLIDRGSDVQDFSGAMRGLTELLRDLVGSNGNLDVALQQREATNQATLRNAQEVLQLEKAAFPNRPTPTLVADGEPPRKGILSSALSPTEQISNVVNGHVQRFGIESEFMAEHAKSRNVNLAKLTASHRELFTAIFTHQARAVGTDVPERFDEKTMQKLAKRALAHVDGLNEAQARTSLMRFVRLREAGTALLASITKNPVENLTAHRGPLGQALVSFLSQVNSTEILSDLINQHPDEPPTTDDRNTAKIAAVDVAFSGVDKATLKRVFDEALDNDSPLRAAYMAFGAHDKNPAIDTDGALNAVISVELIQGLEFIVREVGNRAAVTTPESIVKTVVDLRKSTDFVDFADFNDPGSNPSVVAANPQAKEIFDILKPYIAQRAAYVQYAAEN